jgi:hypothetical protein
MSPEDAAASLLEPSRWDRNTFGPARDLQTAYRAFLMGDISIGELYFLASDLASGADAMGDLAARISQRYGKAATADEVPESAAEPVEPDEVPVVIESLLEAVLEQGAGALTRMLAPVKGSEVPGAGSQNMALIQRLIQRMEDRIAKGLVDPKRGARVLRYYKEQLAKMQAGQPAAGAPSPSAPAPVAQQAPQEPAAPPAPEAAVEEPAQIIYDPNDPKLLFQHGGNVIRTLQAIGKPDGTWQKGQWFETFQHLRDLYAGVKATMMMLQRIVEEARRQEQEGRGNAPFQTGIPATESLRIMEQVGPITLPILTKEHLDVMRRFHKFLFDLRQGRLTNTNVAYHGDAILGLLGPWIQRGSPIGQSMATTQRAQQTVPRGAVRPPRPEGFDPLAAAEQQLADEEGPAEPAAAPAPARPAGVPTARAYAPAAAPAAPAVAPGYKVPPGVEPPAAAPPEAAEDAVKALRTLGYSQRDAQRAVQQAGAAPGTTAANLVTQALAQVGRRA